MPLKRLAPQLALLMILALSVLPGLTKAQDGYRVSGAVVAAENGTPLAGVSISATGAGASTKTNADGRFSLTISAKGSIRLTFSLNGYRPVTKSIDSSTSAVIISMKQR